jgi:hypothetical protein
LRITSTASAVQAAPARRARPSLSSPSTTRPTLDRKSAAPQPLRQIANDDARLVNVLKGANQEVPEDLLKFGTTVKKKAHDSYGTFFKDVDMSKKGTKITFD